MPLIIKENGQRLIVTHRRGEDRKPEIIVSPAKTTASSTTDFDIKALTIAVADIVHKHFIDDMSFYNTYTRKTAKANDENEVAAAFLAHLLRHLAPIKPFPQNRQFDGMVKNQIKYDTDHIEERWAQFNALAA